MEGVPIAIAKPFSTPPQIRIENPIFTAVAQKGYFQLACKLQFVPSVGFSRLSLKIPAGPAR
jgi:hypothetical protein